MYDSLVLGQVSKDINIDYDGAVHEELGGAVVQSGYAAAGMGHKTAVLPKGNRREVDLEAVFADAPNIDVYPLDSPTTTSIRNVYHTADKERRTTTALSRVEPYRVAEIPAIEARIYHMAGLMRGDLGDEIIDWARGRGDVALDVQGALRCAEAEGMVFHDWPDKKKYLPKIRFLKTDAAEAEILTGLTDRPGAAALLHSWGAEEIMITHNTEVLVLAGEKLYTQPIKARNLSGRSGRGDTAFSVYITERLTAGPEEALRLAAGAVSLKMETPGPFKGSRADVLAYLEAFYPA